MYTVVAMGNHQAAILNLEIEGYAPPKIREADDYLRHLIQISELSTIAQTDILSITRKGAHPVAHSSLLMVAPNLGYAFQQ